MVFYFNILYIYSFMRERKLTHIFKVYTSARTHTQRLLH